MTLRLDPVDSTFGAVVRDVDLRTLDDNGWADVRDAWLEYGLLVVRDQHLDRPEQDDVARRFGDLEFTATALTNICDDGTVRDDRDHDLNRSLRGNEGWHHDSTYMPVQAKGAVFSAEIIPSEGGATGFADMRAAWDALGEDDREMLAGRTARHSRRYSMERAGHVIDEQAAARYRLYGYHDVDVPVRPLVGVHPDTGRTHLTAGQHAHAVSGLDPADSQALLDRIETHATAAPRTYHHEWSVGDIVIWDNRRLMHRATDFDYAEPRRMWHTRIAGDPATETALNHR